MSSDCTTARRADDQRRSVDDVSFCAISETGTQSAARYRGALQMKQRRVKMMTLYCLNALRHVKPMEIVMHQLHQAAVKLHYFNMD